MTHYPDVEAEASAYKAAIRYDGGPLIVFDGGHDTFAAARARAIRLAAALRQAGEMGVSGMVTFSGDRPEGFPRNGVHA